MPELEPSYRNHFYIPYELLEIVNQHDYKYWLPVIEVNNELVTPLKGKYTNVELSINLFNDLYYADSIYIKVGTCDYNVWIRDILNNEDEEILWEDISIINFESLYKKFLRLLFWIIISFITLCFTIFLYNLL